VFVLVTDPAVTLHSSWLDFKFVGKGWRRLEMIQQLDSTLGVAAAHERDKVANLAGLGPAFVVYCVCFLKKQ